MKLHLLPLFLCLITLTSCTSLKHPNILYQAHAHNDYAHKRPLLDALDQGFNSIEADIFLHNNQLLVGHDKKDLTPSRTLQKLYLDPLFARYKKHQGKIHPNSTKPLILLIDFKSDGQKLYPKFVTALQPYKKMLTSAKDNTLNKSAVTIIISGKSPHDLIFADKNRHAFIDGRIKNLNQNYPNTIMPLISASWKSHFKWKGKGPFPKNEIQKLKNIINQTHKQGKIIRFWGTLDNPFSWQFQQNHNIDLINTDKLKDLAIFLNNQK